MRTLTLLLFGAFALLSCDTFPTPPIDRCDGVDQDDDGIIDNGADVDGDGFYRCGPDGLADCNDLDLAIHPGAMELCDGQDGDCDGVILAIEVDADADGARVCDADCDDTDPAANLIDGDGDGWASCRGDCDDADPKRYPGAPEACDGIDGDCDGAPDDAELDADGDGQSACAGDCDDEDPSQQAEDRDGDGVSVCGAFPDCDDEAALVYPGASERCDGADNDCDGEIDDGCP